jgi:anti-sigma regulatory factor (Ser/Thr protein kinase)
MPNATGRPLEFQHDAFLYRSDEALVTAMVPFLRAGLARGQATVAITTPHQLALLRDGLGPDAARVRLVDGADWYLRPEAAIADYDAAVRELTEGGAPLVRAVAQLPSDSTAEEHLAWTRYEAIVNRAFRGLPLWVVCLYDERELPPGVVADARRTHPTLWQANRRRANRGYVEPAALLGELPDPSPAAVGQPSLRLQIDGDRHGWRRPVAAAVSSEGLATEGVEEFLLAVGEVVGNAVRHGGGRAQLALWVTDSGVMCEVTDRGPGMDDPFAGYLPPGSGDAAQGMGLWVARQLSDMLTVQSGPDGTTVRLAVSR